MKRRAFILAGSSALAIAGIGGWQLLSLKSSHQDLLNEIDKLAASDPELDALKKLLHEPGPAEEKLKGIELSVLFYELDLSRIADGPYKHQTHLFHYRHHYLEYVWGWNEAQNKIIEKANIETKREPLKIGDVFPVMPDDKSFVNIFGSLAIFHAQYWHQFQPVGKRMIDFEGGKKRIDTFCSRLLNWISTQPKPDWLVFLQNEEGIIYPHVMQQNNIFHPKGTEIIFIADLMNHAWRLDFPAIDLAIKGLLQSISLEQFELFESSIGWSYKQPNEIIEHSLPRFMIPASSS